MMNLVIPKGKLAGAQQLSPEQMQAKLKEEERRRKLRDDLLRGNPVPISTSGEAGSTHGATIIPGGKLAGAQQVSTEEMKRIMEEEKKRREETAKALREGRTMTISHGGGAGQPGTMQVPKGKLAVALQWYERDPSLLVAEKAAMARAFPNFQLEQIGDGRLAWTGTLTPGIWKGFWAAEGDISARQTWEVMAIYENNHPHQQMGSSVKVFLLSPTIQTVIEQIGWRPYHLLHDPISNQDYLCTAQAEDVKVGETSTSAASVLAWAVKWLTAFELVMTGDLSKEDFNTHGVI